MSRYVWKTTADRIVRRYYPECGSAVVAEMLGIEPSKVRDYARKNGIKTHAPRGKPFASIDSRRGHGKPFARAECGQECYP